MKPLRMSTRSKSMVWRKSRKAHLTRALPMSDLLTRCSTTAHAFSGLKHQYNTRLIGLLHTLLPQTIGFRGTVQSRGRKLPVHPPSPRGQASFPRRRESIVDGLVPRLRGEDGSERDLDLGGDFAHALISFPAGMSHATAVMYDEQRLKA